MRFRQLVRAHNILSDAEQRATYDQLLAIATRPPAPPRQAMVYEKIHRGATNTMAATFIAAALIGSYAVFSHMSKTSAMSDGAARAAVNAPLQVTAAPAGPADVLETAAERHLTATISEASRTDSVAAAANAINPPLAVIALPALAASPVPTPADARTLRERGIYAYRGGDLGAALAHFNLAIEQDPGFAAAYIDRGIVLYRMRNFDRAFADMAQAKRLARTSKDKPKSVAQAPHRPPAPLNVSQGVTPRWRMTAAMTP